MREVIIKVLKELLAVILRLYGELLLTRCYRNLPNC